MYTEELFSMHEVDQQLMSRDELLQKLKTNLERLVNRMKQMADQKEGTFRSTLANGYF
jgi:uncharacterized coiled-coil protein SlyX